MIAVTIANGAEFRIMAEMAATSFRKYGLIDGQPFDDVIILQPAPDGLDPRLAKLRLFDLVDDDQFFYFDADAMMVREFDLACGVAESGFSAVTQAHPEARRFHIDASKYFNSGVMWPRRCKEHLSLFTCAANLPDQSFALGDQTKLNIAARDLGITIVPQPSALNWIVGPNDDYPADTIIVHRVAAPSRIGTIEAMKRDAI